MNHDDPHADRAALTAEVAHLHALLADSDARRAAHEDLLVRFETLESRRLALELMVDAYADLFDFAPVAYLALDASGQIRDANLTATTMLEAERHYLIGRPLRLHIAAADRRKFLDHMMRCRKSHVQVACELHLQLHSGRELPVQLLSRRAVVSTDSGLTFRTVIVDLSERRRTEEALQTSHQRLELAIAASEAGLFETLWPAGDLQVSDRWAEILGHTRDTLPPGPELTSWWHDRIDPDQREAHNAAFTAFLSGQTPTHVADLRVRHASGAWMWVRELAQVADRYPGGRVRRVVGVMVDVTAEKTRLAEARARTSQLQSLAAALFRVEENERRELATQLHDDLGQRLVAVKLRLSAIDHPALTPVLALIDDTQSVIRSLAFQASPPILQDLGLIAGLRWLAREFTTRYNLPVTVDADGPLPPLVGDPSFLLFRCVRELLFNVVKHASASAASISVVTATAEPNVHIIVEDDGAGFDPQAAIGPSRSFGLLSVRERLGWLGGDTVVDSAPDQGTRVRLIVPCLSPVVVHVGSDEP